MTEFMPPAKTLQIIDPRMRTNQERVQAVQIGPKNNTYRVISADTNLSPNTVNFNYNATSVHDIIDRRFLVRYFLRAVITGTGNPLTSHGVSDSLRFLPINSTCTSLQVTINNSHQSVIPFQWLDGISRYVKLDDLRSDLSSSPSTTDLLFDYAAGSGAKNVMGSYVDNSINSPDLRGSIVTNSITEGDGTSTIEFEIIEPLFITPLTYQDRDVPGFTGVESLSVQLSHSWEGETAWSHTGATTLSTFTFTMYSTPQLLLNIMTPNELVEPYNPMRTYTYNSVNMRHYPTDVGSIAAGATQTINSGNIQLNAIPSRIYVFARKRKVDRLVTDPDVFAQIESVNVSLGNKTSLLGFATPRDLYKISVRNGYQYSYNAWRHYQGGVLCFKPSADLSLDLGEAPGLVVQKQLQISLSIKNQTANTQNYELIIIPVLPGSFYISNGIASQSVGLLNPDQVFASPVSTSDEIFRDHENSDIYGSGLFDLLRKAFKVVAPIVAPFVGDLAVKGVDALGKLLKGKIQKRAKRGRGIQGRGAYVEEYSDDESDDDEVITVSRKSFSPFHEI